MGNHLCCASELLSRGASARRDAHGAPALQKAAERCGERMVDVLLEARRNEEKSESKLKIYRYYILISRYVIDKI